jgi:hypothetical protein
VSLAVAGVALSAQPRELAWDVLQQEGRVRAGAVVAPEAGTPFHTLKIEGQGSVSVLVVEQPSVKGPRYALTGQVRYDAVEGDAYLELWNHFPDGRAYFSRTLADAGPMMKLHGTSAWRTFTLPFDATGAPLPTRLVVNVVLPGRGTVFLGPIRIVDGTVGIDESTGLRLEQTSGAWGALAGGIIGSVGALIGVLTSLGRAKRFVSASTIILIITGTVSFVAGVVALGQAQPYAVYYPLLLVGFLAAVIPLALRSSIHKRYEELELRRMRAHDLG